MSVSRAGVLGFVKIGQGYSQMSAMAIALYDPLWATIQQGCSVVCCCVPIYKPLIPTLGIFSRLRSFGSRTLGRRSGSGSSGAQGEKLPLDSLQEAKLPLDSLQVSATTWDQGQDHAYHLNQADAYGSSMDRLHDGAYTGAREEV